MRDDSLSLQELADRAATQLRSLRILNRTLYVAHVTYGKSIETLAEQTGRAPADIAKRIDFVHERLARQLREDL